MPGTFLRRSAAAILPLSLLLTVTACGSGVDPAADGDVPTSSSTSTPAPSDDAPSAIDPEPEPEETAATSGWTSQAGAAAVLDAFSAEVLAAERFRVMRTDRIGFGPDYLDTFADYLVDLSVPRMLNVSGFEVSSAEVAEQMLDNTLDGVAALENHTIFDYTPDGLRTLMTFPSEWDGQWLEMNEDTAAEDGMLEGSPWESPDPGFVADPLHSLLQLEPVAWRASTEEVELEVPLGTGIELVSARVYAQLAEQGLSLEDATVAATALAREVDGGVEITVDLTELIASVPGGRGSLRRC